MACKTLQEFLSIYYERIKEFVLFSVNIRQKSEVELKLFESKCNIFSMYYRNIKLEVTNFQSNKKYKII